MSEEKKANGQIDPTDEKMALKLAEQDQEPENELDSSKVKFINGGSSAADRGDIRLDIDDKKVVDNDAFCGLTKEELMIYAKDPFWVKVRWILLILFWVAWFAMLAAAIIIIVFAPKCPPRPSLSWWQKSLTYQIYPKSFLDTDSNGVGDVKGIQDKIEHFKKLNITAVYLSAMYQADKKSLDPVFGTEEDLDNLIAALHKKGIRVIMDFVPNYTDKKSVWFQKSRNGTEKYNNYYVWHQGKTVNGQRQPPNNWLSVHGGSAWTYDDVRGEYYLHQFLSDQPDLNVSHPEVQADLDSVLTHWLEKGVDGFKISHLAHLFEVDTLDVDEVRSDANVPESDYDYLIHNLTTFQPGMYEMATRWRTLLDAYSENEGRNHPRLLVAEVGEATPDQLMKLYDYKNKSGLHMPLNAHLLTIEKGCDAVCVHKKVHEWVTVVPPGQTETDKWSNWQVGNSDTSRVASRMDQSLVNAVNMLTMTLPGTAFMYYGEEIGMHDVDISFDETKDPVGIKYGKSGYQNYSRDPERTPMQWNGDVNAGFTSGTPWLPLAADYKMRNVQAQSAHGSGITEMEVFQSLAAARSEPSMQWGVMEDVVINKDILSYVRQAEGFPGFLVAINFGTEPATVDFHAASEKFVPMEGKVVASTENFESAGRSEDFKPGKAVTLDAVHLRPTEGVLVKFDFMK